MNNRRYFFIRAAQAKKAAKAASTQIDAAPISNVIQFGGRTIQITDKNRSFVERIMANDADAAFDAALHGVPHQSRLQLAA